jgi:CCR4-NOT transcription complex subunit 2
VSQLPFRQGAFQDAQQQQPGPIGSRPTQIQRQLDQSYGLDAIESPNNGPPRQKRLAEMTEQERFGLPGLLAMIPPESPDHCALVVGQDLTVLGLDLNRPE